jgi:hypothetical protein
MSTARRDFADAGNSSSSLVGGGYIAANTNATEEFTGAFDTTTPSILTTS